MATKKNPEEIERRRREVIALVSNSEILMAQHRDSRARHERGERGIPGEQVRAEAKARRQRA